jgi:hypothetical protein
MPGVIGIVITSKLPGKAKGVLQSVHLTFAENTHPATTPET